MPIYADLSPSGLLPSAVLTFVRAHATHRPQENILFKVNKDVFDLYTSSLPKAVVASEAEAYKMNEFLGTAVSANQYTLTGRLSCSNCKRTFTFYDVFESGRKRHGDAFMRRFLGGNEFHIQVAASNETNDVDCTNCGTLNDMLRTGTHYSGPQYTYV